MAPDGPVTFVTDGGVDVRALPLSLNPHARCILDWFGVTMRITVLAQLAKGLPPPPPTPNVEQVDPGVDPGIDAARQLERIKWFLWHGNVDRARQTLEDLAGDLHIDGPGPEPRKLLKPYETSTAISGPTPGPSRTTQRLPGRRDHFQRHRRIDREPGHRQTRGDKASNAVDAGRRPPIFQVRTAVLNNELADIFHRRYPEFTHRPQSQDLSS